MKIIDFSPVTFSRKIVIGFINADGTVEYRVDGICSTDERYMAGLHQYNTDKYALDKIRRVSVTYKIRTADLQLVLNECPADVPLFLYRGEGHWVLHYGLGPDCGNGGRPG